MLEQINWTLVAQFCSIAGFFVVVLGFLWGRRKRSSGPELESLPVKTLEPVRNDYRPPTRVKPLAERELKLTEPPSVREPIPILAENSPGSVEPISAGYATASPYPLSSATAYLRDTSTGEIPAQQRLALELLGAGDRVQQMNYLIGKNAMQNPGLHGRLTSSDEDSNLRPVPGLFGLLGSGKRG